MAQYRGGNVTKTTDKLQEQSGLLSTSCIMYFKTLSMLVMQLRTNSQPLFWALVVVGLVSHPAFPWVTTQANSPAPSQLVHSMQPAARAFTISPVLRNSDLPPSYSHHQGQFYSFTGICCRSEDLNEVEERRRMAVSLHASFTQLLQNQTKFFANSIRQLLKRIE